MAGDLSDLDLGATMRGFNAGQRLFDRYALKEILGRGGMGIVWRAFDEQLERDVALKFLPEMVAFDEQAIKDLKRETKKSQELRHHHIVQVYDFVADKQHACIAMEYVDGPTLSALKARKEAGFFEVDEIKGWIEQLCEALSYAHERARVVHRDLKPANLMVNSKGELKVTDFGIARSVSDSVSMLTMARGTSGTLVYMSPQQLGGQRASHLDDIYSLGATIYELLTSKPPFYTGDVTDQIKTAAPVSIQQRRAELELTGASIPKHWEQTISACLAKDPAQRPQSVVEVAERLGLRTASPRLTAVAAAEKPPQKKAIAWILGTALVLLLAAVGYYFASQRGPAKVAVAEKVQPVESAAPSPSLSVPPTSSTAPALAETTPQIAAPTASPATTIETTGAITVTTEPPGASVTIGDMSGKTPVTLSGIQAGKQRLKLSLDGFEPIQREAEIKANETSALGTLALAQKRADNATPAPGSNQGKIFAGTWGESTHWVQTGLVYTKFNSTSTVVVDANESFFGEMPVTSKHGRTLTWNGIFKDKDGVMRCTGTMTVSTDGKKATTDGQSVHTDKSGKHDWTLTYRGNLKKKQ